MQAALPASAPAPMARKAMAEEAKAAAPIRARTDFAALALFAASVPLDAEGRARVPVKLPDSLTRYRVMAVAAAGARRFGSGEAALVARLPLMVRPSPPRFLNFGDRFELPVVVQNQTDREMTVDVAVRARNAALTDGDGRRVVVAANDRAEVRFPMAAARAGTARIQVGAVSGAAADAAEVELPVWTPATTEAFATYGQLDAGAVVQPVRAPEGARPEFGGLELTTSSTALQALTDAVLYLVAYPFECAEQLSSRVLAVAALRDVLTAFEAEGLPKPDELEAAVERDLERLRALQNDDGGFAFWRRGDRSWPYVSIHVAHALGRAKAKGFAVPDDTLERSRRYLREIDRHIPKEYGDDVRRTLQAYALATRAVLGDPDPARARALVREAAPDGLSFEALGFVLPLLSKDAASQAELAAVRRRIANGVTETAGAAHFAVSYGDGAHLLLHSDRRADAILLEALIADQPAKRPHPQAGGGPARAPHGGALDEHAGERLRAAGARPLLPGLREDDARLRRARLARRALRGSARLPGPHHRAAPRRDPDGRAPRSGRHERPAAREGGRRAPLLPDRPALRAAGPDPRAARPRLHGRARLRGCRRPGRRDARRGRHLADPRGRARARAR